MYGLDGVIGWLTYYCYLRSKGVQEALKKAVDDDARMIANEFQQFLSYRQLAGRRYVEVMKILERPSTWSEVKRRLCQM